MPASEEWVIEHRLTDEEYEAAGDRGCSGGQQGVLGSVAVTGRPGEAIVSLGVYGVLVRSPDGTWTRHRVLDADRGPTSPLGRSVAFWVLLGAVPVGAVAVWLSGRRGSIGRVVGLTLVPVGVVVVLGWTVLVSLVSDEQLVIGRGHLIAAGAVVLVAVALARIPPPSRPLPGAPGATVSVGSAPWAGAQVPPRWVPPGPPPGSGTGSGWRPAPPRRPPPPAPRPTGDGPTGPDAPGG